MKHQRGPAKQHNNSSKTYLGLLVFAPHQEAFLVIQLTLK